MSTEELDVQQVHPGTGRPLVSVLSIQIEETLTPFQQANMGLRISLGMF